MSIRWATARSSAADDAAVHHHRAVLAAVRADVLQAEPLGLVEVDLHGSDAGLAFGAVGDLHVDLGAVERGLAFLGLVGQAGGRRARSPAIAAAPVPAVLAADVLG